MKHIKKILLLFITVVMTIILFEIFLLFTNIDTKLLEHALYYQCADLEVHVDSSNPNRLYELNPNSKAVFENVHSNETKYSNRIVSINSLGFRDRERNRTKADGVFRIIILGGSNTYGAMVRNQDTYPAIMQKLLNEQFPDKFEVWNAGISAYVMSQKVAYADYIIKEFNPDLLIFQIGNMGRRPFVYNEEFIELFKKNKELYLENIPFLFSNNPTLLKIHYYLVLHSRFYRLIITEINNIIIKDINNWHENGKLGNSYAKIINKYNAYGSMISKRDFDNFLNNNKNIKVIILDPNGQIYCDPDEYKEYKNIEYFSLCPQNKSEEYKEIHPPSYVYEWYAEELVKMLINRKHINITK